MGEVWRATDTRLEREVAIKALPEDVARDPERLARFEREAKVLASLSHPNIASVYGLEEAHGERFLVMELAEGEDLAERLKRGPCRSTTRSRSRGRSRRPSRKRTRRASSTGTSSRRT
jgi:serine/threonine protein kinase